YLYIFFFQAEDGIRDATVTGVQTCALPIWPKPKRWTKQTIFPRRRKPPRSKSVTASRWQQTILSASSLRKANTRAARRTALVLRSEERRVGEERRSR